MTSMRVSSGMNYRLEAQANELLRKSREGVTKLSEKKDYLTEDQLELRWEKEVPNGHGFPEAHLVSGLFKRSYNPLAGKRPTSRSRLDNDGGK
ncbi:hypothetical protein KHO57_gp152 [Mycobacterium phage Phabba]|uniref:Uncharacterized protein n=1 Tax=Mycobacterium phage Phabba TaxID=2027899 RepID=A0A249XSM5_9CAUD|nr:hypothetical protein KHO57_gp152 [Mycobacterium phage Phabba]ASZ74752.1 hypothetical protein SEA_PHABBA_213 [Mycobacterium phage Phabba]